MPKCSAVVGPFVIGIEDSSRWLDVDSLRSMEVTRMRRNAFGAAAFSLFIMTGCIVGKTQIENGAHFSSGRTSQPNESELIKATVGEIFDIELQGNPSAGYDWQIAKLDDELLKLIDASFVPNGPDGVVGSGGTAVFKLLPLKAGEAELKLIYKRPWTTDVLKTKTYRVVISGAADAD